MRRLSLLDLLPGGAGLLRDCVCVRPLHLPKEVERWTHSHERWASDALYAEHGATDGNGRGGGHG
jgi:hypothetical protein